MFVAKFVKKQSGKGDRLANKKSSSTKSFAKVQRNTGASRKQLVRIHHAPNCPHDGHACRISEHWHLAARCGTSSSTGGASVPYIWHFSSQTATVLSYTGRCPCKHPRCDNICRLVRETTRRTQYDLCIAADCQVCCGVREKMGQTKSSGVWV